jgi:hypothetical protein
MGLLALASGGVMAQTPPDALIVNETGRVGVGTATPTAKLHTFENVDANTFVLAENAGTGLSSAGVLRAKSNAASVNFQAHGNGRTIARFGQTLASWAEFLQVDGNGLIIGTNGAKPLILGTAATNRLTIAGTGQIGLGGVFSPTQPLQHANGAYLSAGGQWVNASSRELKEKIEVLTVPEAQDVLAGLAPVRYQYKAEAGQMHLGFIAEEVPEAVATADRKGLSPMDIVAVLTKVVQEQQRTIEQLNQKVTLLENAQSQ